MSGYRDALCQSMAALAAHPKSVFVGQAVGAPGTAMFGTLQGVPMEKRLEFPVAEDCQMGFCTGLSLAGYLPVCLFPRFNFLLLAMNQLVLHLDKLPKFSSYRPKVIIRTAVATDQPLDPGPQHLGDFTEPLRAMLEMVKVVRLDRAEDVGPAYRRALERPGSTVLVERTELYDK